MIATKDTRAGDFLIAEMAINVKELIDDDAGEINHHIAEHLLGDCDFGALSEVNYVPIGMDEDGDILFKVSGVVASD